MLRLMLRPRCVEGVVASLLYEWHRKNKSKLYTIYETMRVVGKDPELEKGQ